MTAQAPPVLTISGSHCSEGAGVRADLKTFCALQCSTFTALTAQNTTGVEDVHPVPPSFIEKQVEMDQQPRMGV
ncbi:hypothetical protein Agabi119p4_3940 [Agaricus bisporus var. burnettii]|uniref:Pyridoxamine kinase/Phosphomethylpyrimidine kinase domain-containing protein n=1 Tax=Agaricus bisporus var. burnettii TaxID=192524 RepID=A0A8H7F5L7_AGABI|nr:hypothetical protein Agabi119p4_3940 [Agaricus bisporus var. burnettii]